MNERAIKVLIVDDSAAMRQLLTQILSADPDINVVGTASDPYFAREKIIKFQPDVLTLDVEMPRMDGLTFLEKLMRAHPMPVVMVSSLTQNGCDVTLRALELGAVDFFSKPTIDTLSGVADGARNIIAKVKGAARARIAAHPAVNRPHAPTVMSKVSVGYRLTHQLVAIGASTGGTEAIREVLMAMPPDAPGIVIVQHMPPGFTASFSDRLNTICAIEVKEAEEGDTVRPGRALIAPGNFHMRVQRSGAQYRVKLSSDPPVNHHRPSVDVLFDSCAEQAGKNLVAAILTGMGNDGAKGMRRIYNEGARTIAQDEATCVVFGMPKEAIAEGGAEFILPLHKVAAKLVDLASTVETSASA